MLQKRLEYGFNGYQVPPTPKAARSARRRIKKGDDKSQMCAFDLLATVAGKLLQDGDTSLKDSANNGKIHEIPKKTIKIEEQQLKEETPLNVNVCDQESCNKSFFMTEILSQTRVTDEVKNDTYSGITVSSEKVLSVPVDKGKHPFGCKLEDKNKIMFEERNNGKSPFVNSLDNSVKFPYWKDHGPRGPSSLCQNNVNLVNRDDEENSSGCTEPRALKNKRIGDRRIRRFLASKYWNEAPNLNDEVHFDNESDVHRNRKTCYKRQRSLRDYPFKKRRLYELHNVSNSDGAVCSDDRSSSPINDSIEDVSDFGAKPERGMGKSGFSKQNLAFQSTNPNVKLKIKSFRVPELFIEIPETATVGSLKRTVMEAVNAILRGELSVGVMLQGKKIRDDNKTLLQAGLCHENTMDALGFTLESDQLQVFTTLCSEDQSFVLPPDMPKPLTRYLPPPTVTNKVSDDPPMTNFSNLIESDHDSAPSPPDMSVDSKIVSDSRALVTVPAMNAGPLAVVPMRKSKRAEVAQRRIRRPFSVSEVEALVQAVEKLGTGRWRDVKLRAFDNAKHRTYVDLKDKWKTLVHTARISPQQRRGEPVPQELLDRVLAAHAYWSHHQAKQQFKHHPLPQTCRLL